MSALGRGVPIAVIGAGTMGAGIAQVAAAAGHAVQLFDVADGAAARGVKRVAEGIDTLVARGRMARADADALVGRIAVAERLEDLAPAGLVVEAVLEDLAVKQALVARLETVLSSDAIIASNTSSISITSVARDAVNPGRVIGMHFFNPAPVMKLVEVVSGIATAPSVAAAVFDTAAAWGKVAVHARSTPGFIVNRVARTYYGEAFRLYEEGVADPATIDALLTEGAGFRMGPFALMDLIGHDVNYAVSTSVFAAFYDEPRFRPSITQLELVNAGRLGRKSGRGVFDYGEHATMPLPTTEPVDPGGRDGALTGIDVVDSDGRTAAQVARANGRPALVCDLIVPKHQARRIGFAASPDVPDSAIACFVATCGVPATRLPDWPGLISTRTLATIVNEGFEAVMQGVASEADVDRAMRFGVNYPRGPIEWARDVGLSRILSVLDNLLEQTGDPRYRASLALRRAVEKAI